MQLYLPSVLLALCSSVAASALPLSRDLTGDSVLPPRRHGHDEGKGFHGESSSGDSDAQGSSVTTNTTTGAIGTPTVTSSSSGTTYSGQATWFEVGLGACGYTDTDADFIVALDSPLYESGNYCNMYLVVTNTENGKSATARVRDECPTCAYGSLDMSPSLFESLAEGGLDEGVFPITWNFIS